MQTMMGLERATHSCLEQNKGRDFISLPSDMNVTAGCWSVTCPLSHLHYGNRGAVSRSRPVAFMAALSVVFICLIISQNLALPCSQLCAVFFHSNNIKWEWIQLATQTRWCCMVCQRVYSCFQPPLPQKDTEGDLPLGIRSPCTSFTYPDKEKAKYLTHTLRSFENCHYWITLWNNVTKRYVSLLYKTVLRLAVTSAVGKPGRAVLHPLHNDTGSRFFLVFLPRMAVLLLGNSLFVFSSHKYWTMNKLPHFLVGGNAFSSLLSENVSPRAPNSFLKCIFHFVFLFHDKTF